MQGIAGVALGDEVEVALDGVVRPARLQIRLIDADQTHEPIAGLAGDLHVPTVVGVAVVVDPLVRNHPLVHLDRLRQIDVLGDSIAAIEESLLEVGQCLAGSEPPVAQAMHDLDEAVVAQGLELADRHPRSLQLHLRVALLADRVEQLVGQLGDVHQLGPRPLQRRPELGHEVAHARLPTGDPVDQERAHEAPAQAGAETHRIVDLGCCGDSVVDEPQGLPPQGLHQPVGDEPVDLFREDQRLHADAAIDLGRTLLRRF